MKKPLGFILVVFLFSSCETKKTSLDITGTWKLLSGTLIENNVATVTDYTKDKEFIKIINATHFAFLGHDLNHGKDSSAYFSSGGGPYSLTDSSYTEHLEYCNERQWEHNDFKFTVSINNDTLQIKGIEKVEGTNVNRLNIEKYIRVKE
ncbi:MAG TPA: hypothetical protein VMH01_14950 [Puia sp.]|nr:hypothetical protein [Puia sp.]